MSISAVIEVWLNRFKIFNLNRIVSGKKNHSDSIPASIHFGAFFPTGSFYNFKDSAFFHLGRGGAQYRPDGLSSPALFSDNLSDI